MKRFITWLFRIPQDQFRLDHKRIISIDGHEFIIEGWSSSISYSGMEFLEALDRQEIDVRFKRYKKPSRVGRSDPQDRYKPWVEDAGQDLSDRIHRTLDKLDNG